MGLRVVALIKGLRSVQIEDRGQGLAGLLDVFFFVCVSYRVFILNAVMLSHPFTFVAASVPFCLFLTVLLRSTSLVGGVCMIF